MARWADYQMITTIAAKIGGPRILALAVAGTGALLYKGGEVGVKFTVRKAKEAKKKFDARAQEAAESHLFSVTADVQAGGGLTLRAGDEFRVLARDADAILIRVLGDATTPYYMSGELLASVSDFSFDGE
ncbi:hypothetical protein E3T25_04720 [Cryobacterium sandaracinum]|uniref:Uncharacterized protein n=1 Tax=Cryobacterium sandaracinum TaxID=1259247 RepID=A0ABY2JFR5_9MICO|nr:hypothetical protein [Cryobacterium sandaracinum]TFD04822.1 hypothetical protein E3T25_04720 [Cryobacterium sandaracinum]